MAKIKEIRAEIKKMEIRDMNKINQLVLELILCLYETHWQKIKKEITDSKYYHKTKEIQNTMRGYFKKCLCLNKLVILK